MGTNPALSRGHYPVEFINQAFHRVLSVNPISNVLSLIAAVWTAVVEIIAAIGPAIMLSARRLWERVIKPLAILCIDGVHRTAAICRRAVCCVVYIGWMWRQTFLALFGVASLFAIVFFFVSKVVAVILAFATLAFAARQIDAHGEDIKPPADWAVPYRWADSRFAIWTFRGATGVVGLWISLIIFYGEDISAPISSTLRIAESTGIYSPETRDDFSDRAAPTLTPESPKEDTEVSATAMASTQEDSRRGISPIDPQDAFNTICRGSCGHRFNFMEQEPLIAIWCTPGDVDNDLSPILVCAIDGSIDVSMSSITFSAGSTRYKVDFDDNRAVRFISLNASSDHNQLQEEAISNLQMGIEWLPQKGRYLGEGWHVYSSPLVSVEWISYQDEMDWEVKVHFEEGRFVEAYIGSFPLSWFSPR